MQTHWRSDECYAGYGVDGSLCSFRMYLSEVCITSVNVCITTKHEIFENGIMYIPIEMFIFEYVFCIDL